VPTKLDYMLSGCANGHPVRIQGTGSVSGKRLRFAIWPIEEPLDFDPALALLACLDPLLLVAAGVIRAPTEGFTARTRIDLVAEGGVDAGTLVVVSTVQRRQGRVQCRAQLAEARVRLEVGERLVEVDERTIVVHPLGAGPALSSATTVRTSRGGERSVLATAKLADAEGVVDHLALPAFTIRRVGGRASVTFELRK
jgi:hypothetical protein